MRGQFVIKDKIMFKINPKVGYLSNDIRGNFVILTDFDHAMTFATEAEALAYVKEHKLGKMVEIEKTYE